MKLVVFTAVIIAMTFATFLGCGNDDDMEQYYKDAQLKGTRIPWDTYGMGESVATLTEFKTACEILAALEFELEDGRFEMYRELNQREMTEWLDRFNPAEKYVAELVDRSGHEHGRYSAHKSRAGSIMWAILKPTIDPNTDPPNYWDSDTYWYSPDADYPPRGFCKYVAGLKKPPISDQAAQWVYESYMDNLLDETYGDAQYYLESEIGNKSHLRKYYEDVQADLQEYPSNVSETEFLTACELYEGMSFRLGHEDAIMEDIFREQADKFNPTHDVIVRDGLFDAQIIRGISIMSSIQNPRGLFLLGDAVPVQTQKALCEYVVNR